MNRIIFETESAIFSFDLTDVLTLLACYSCKHQIEEAADLLRTLESMPGDLRKVPRQNGFFGYIALDLLDKGKGSAFCKICKKEYQAPELHPFPVGCGDNPLAVNLERKGGFFKRFLRGRNKRIGMSGGKGFKCPEAHELLALITWIT